MGPLPPFNSFKISRWTWFFKGGHYLKEILLILNSFSFEDKDPRFPRLKPGLALRLLSKGLFFIRAMVIAHCVLLKHYYSVNFLWWFDGEISFFFVKWQNVKLVSNFIRWPNILIILEVKSMDESSWKKKIYCISFYSSLCRASPFHREWPQLVTILISFDLSFEKKFKSLKY